MTLNIPDLQDPRVIAAIEELTTIILRDFPGSVIEPEIGDDPLAVYLIARVDIDDTDEVMDLVVDRLVELNVYDRIPIHVIPLRTEEREWKMRAEEEAAKAAGIPPMPLYD